jgi:hypothetical protein
MATLRDQKMEITRILESVIALVDKIHADESGIEGGNPFLVGDIAVQDINGFTKKDVIRANVRNAVRIIRGEHSTLTQMYKINIPSNEDQLRQLIAQKVYTEYVNTETGRLINAATWKKIVEDFISGSDATQKSIVNDVLTRALALRHP